MTTPHAAGGDGTVAPPRPVAAHVTPGEIRVDHIAHYATGDNVIGWTVDLTSKYASILACSGNELHLEATEHTLDVDETRRGQATTITFDVSDDWQLTAEVSRYTCTVLASRIDGYTIVWSDTGDGVGTTVDAAGNIIEPTSERDAGDDTGREAGGVPTARLRAAIDLLGPDELTPTAARILRALCDEHDTGHDGTSR